MADAQTPKTYVLAGFDHNGALQDTNALYAKDTAHFIVLDVAHYPKLEDAIRAIKTPANVILNCHGYDWKGAPSFDWGKDEAIPYSQLFGDLKHLQASHHGKGVDSVTISSCKGGNAENAEILASAPAGMVVQTLISDTNLEMSSIVTRFAQNNVDHPAADQTALYIRALSAFTPQDYQADLEALKAKDPTLKDIDTNPEHALPHMIGIGGNPPILIDIHDQVNQLSASLKANGPDDSWQQSVRRTCRIFGATTDMPVTGADADAMAASMQQGVTPSGKDPKGIAIAIVANKMQKGEPITGVQEERIAYALTAAYMDASGNLQKMVASQKAAAKAKTHPANGPRADADDVIKQHGEILAALTQNVTSPASVDVSRALSMAKRMSADTKQIG
jgi:hypothetical protein